jgi:hypothetical protein
VSSGFTAAVSQIPRTGWPGRALEGLIESPRTVSHHHSSHTGGHMAATEISAVGVKNIIKELGYEILKDADDVFTIAGSSGIRIICAVEESILNVTVPLITVPVSKITHDIAMNMLWSENGLSTSHLELVRQGDNANVILMNYCKLQELGDDDRDDIETAIEFIELDVKEDEHGYLRLVLSRRPRGPRQGKRRHGRLRGGELRDHHQPDVAGHEG